MKAPSSVSPRSPGWPEASPAKMLPIDQSNEKFTPRGISASNDARRMKTLSEESVHMDDKALSGTHQ